MRARRYVAGVATVIDIVEDQRLIRDLLADGLATGSSLRVRATFASAEDAWRRWQDDPPQAAIVDIVLPAMNGVQLGVRTKRLHRDLGIVLLSSNAYPALLERLPADVADGWAYMLKDDVDVDAIERAVAGAASGKRLIDPALMRVASSGTLAMHDLTDRQMEMLRLLASGLSNTAIAEQMHLTRKSVENAINRLYSTLGLQAEDAETNRRVVAALLATRLLDIPR